MVQWNRKERTWFNILLSLSFNFISTWNLSSYFICRLMDAEFSCRFCLASTCYRQTFLLASRVLGQPFIYHHHFHFIELNNNSVVFFFQRKEKKKSIVVVIYDRRDQQWNHLLYRVHILVKCLHPFPSPPPPLCSMLAAVRMLVQ